MSNLAGTPRSPHTMQIHNMTDPRPFAVQIYRTDDALFIHVPPPTLTTAQRIGNNVFLLLVALAVIMLPASVGIVFIIVGIPGQKLHEPTLLDVIVGGLLSLILPALTGGYRVFFVFRDKYRCRFTSWSTQFSDGAFTLVRCYKNYSETVVFRTESMVVFRCGGQSERFCESLPFWPLFGRFPSSLASRGRIRNELLLMDGTAVYCLGG